MRYLNKLHKPRAISHLSYCYVTNVSALPNPLNNPPFPNSKYLSISVTLPGDSCYADFDGCQGDPCTAGTNCTDNIASVHAATLEAFACSPCPAGYFDDDGVCSGR